MPDTFYGARLGRPTARRCSTRPSTTPGGRTRSGGTRSAPPAADDVVVYQETDERFWVGVGLHPQRPLHAASTCGSKITSEVRLSSTPTTRPASSGVVAPRRQGVEYTVEHADRRRDRFLILHNDGAENFALATAPVDATSGRLGAADPARPRTPGCSAVDAFADPPW